MSNANNQWNSHIWRGSARDFHALDLDAQRAVWCCEVSAPALILGSTQQDTDIDVAQAGAHGLDIVRRRSGGGMVYVHPVDSLWCDVTIARDDVLWTDDVSTSMLWLGDVFVNALRPWLPTSVYRLEFVAGKYGQSVCFASTSPGEVFSGTAKVVGISQRRTRMGARFQCIMYRQWNPDSWVNCVRSHDVAQHVRTLPVATIDAEPTDVMHALLGALEHLGR
jgi:lipoate-protein ligase A